MTMLASKLLVANRGEVAIRIVRAAAELGMRTVAVHGEDDAASLHTRVADEVVVLPGQGARAYLDIAAVVGAAQERGCDAVHPGYGFLSENATLARACAAAGITFVGPRPEVLDLFGDKVLARAAAQRSGLPVLAGTDGPVGVDEAAAFLSSLGPGAAVMLKAVAGGGGRGMRLVRHLDELAEAHARCASEARAAFGDGAVYAEEYLPSARHIEVQVLGDGTGAVAELGERDCSVQRRHQKLVEVAPSPGLSAALRARLVGAAVRLGADVRYDNIGTFEFLVDGRSFGDDARFAFIEANPRLQVEHTVTEEVTGVDLVEAQLRLAGGASLADLGLGPGQARPARGWAMQLRVNMETMQPDGSTRPTSGTLATFDLPSGRGIRVDTFGYAGYRTSTSYDSLLAKVVVKRDGGDFRDLVAKASRTLSECRITGVETNLTFLQDLMTSPDLAGARLTTRLVDDLVEARAADPGHARWRHAARHFGPGADGGAGGRAGATIDHSDPLAVLAYGKAATEHPGRPPAGSGPTPAGLAGPDGPDGLVGLVAPVQGTVVAVGAAEGDEVATGAVVFVLEAMKMEHEVVVPRGGVVRALLVSPGDTVLEGTPLAFVEPADLGPGGEAATEEADEGVVRADLAEVLGRHARTLDAARPEAVARRRRTGQRTARENVDDLCDPGTFIEYGPLVVAAQRRRRTMAELIEKSPADGMITGIGAVNGTLFGDPASRCAVLAYDYTVFAGTQGLKNHAKTDRLVHIARDGRLPLVLFAEGGGGRPGEDSGDYGDTFAIFATLSGLVPMVGIVSGRCYAGNASLLGCCDVVIAAADSNIGMGGPAMIEGGGLGVYRPEEIGPVDVQVASGVVDVAVADEAEAVAVAKQYLSYFQGPLASGECPDQRAMRGIVPENRLRVYDVRKVVDTLADVGTVLELRRGFGHGMVTALVRVEGRPLGVVANNPSHLGGAIDSDGADKAARFMQLCDAFDIPLLFLCDTPGIMVGPEVEKTALVRHSSRLFLVGANLSVPFFTVLVRKSYGLGGIAMAGGSFRVNTFTVAWPTGEWGTMGLEGSVKLGYRNELAAIADPAERRRFFDEMVAKEYERGKAIRMATGFGIDDVIDPADTRAWVAGLLRSIRPPAPRAAKKRPYVDAW